MFCKIYTPRRIFRMHLWSIVKSLLNIADTPLTNIGDDNYIGDTNVSISCCKFNYVTCDEYNENLRINSAFHLNHNVTIINHSLAHLIPHISCFAFSYRPYTRWNAYRIFFSSFSFRDSYEITHPETSNIDERNVARQKHLSRLLITLTYDLIRVNARAMRVNSERISVLTYRSDSVVFSLRARLTLWNRPYVATPFPRHRHG